MPFAQIKRLREPYHIGFTIHLDFSTCGHTLFVVTISENHPVVYVSGCINGAVGLF